MGDDKFGRDWKHGKNYSRKGRYHKNNLHSQKAGPSKSQVIEKSQMVHALTPAPLPLKQERGNIIGVPAVKSLTRTWIDHLLEHEREHEQAMTKFRAKKTINWLIMVMEAMLIGMALAIGGLIIMLLVR